MNSWQRIQPFLSTPWHVLFRPCLRHCIVGVAWISLRLLLLRRKWNRRAMSKRDGVVELVVVPGDTPSACCQQSWTECLPCPRMWHVCRRGARLRNRPCAVDRRCRLQSPTHCATTRDTYVQRMHSTCDSYVRTLTYCISRIEYVSLIKWTMMHYRVEQ